MISAKSNFAASCCKIGWRSRDYLAGIGTSLWSYADLVQITSASSWLTDPDAFSDPLSPIFVLTVR
jgi:hypothetical protein